MSEFTDSPSGKAEGNFGCASSVTSEGSLIGEGKAMSPMKILVVDDEEAVVALCEHALAKQGFEVRGAYNGADAVRLASSEQFKLVLLDMLMPGMDGMDVFQSLKMKQEGILAVLMTGYGTMDSAIRAIELGFSGFLRKPFTPEKLVTVVKDSIQKAAHIHENARLKSLVPLYALGEKFIKSGTEEEIFGELIETVFRQTGARRISIMLSWS